MLKKIVILGPESTGKSTLCAMLARHFKTLWCPEYARTYLLTNGTKYSFEDLLTIARGQQQLEATYMQQAAALDHAPSILFVDTDQYVMKVWCEYVFNDCHNWILQQIAAHSYDMYLLCKPDLPWVKDALREYPDEKPRQELYKMYRDLLIHQSAPWVEISGGYEARFLQAKNAVETLCV